MRDLPPGPALLLLAREVLIDELVPLLPQEARVKARLVATSMAIAAREAAAGAAPVEAVLGAVRQLYQEDARGDGLLRRFARDLRMGAFETEPSQQRLARAILWRSVVARLREGNPAFLAANGLVERE